MNCPICKAWTEVLETRGNVRRRRCGNEHRFTTEEVVRGPVTKAKEKKKEEDQTPAPPGVTIHRIR